MPEESIIRWTVRLSLLLYAAVAFGQLLQSSRSRRDATESGPLDDRYADTCLRTGRLLRWLWTGGCLLLLAHLAAAFHWVHAWSHAHAYEDTARQTEALLGWPFGGGVWVNYLFAAVWTLDVIVWWLFGVDTYARRGRTLTGFMHGFMLFIIFNATVTFKTGAVRYAAIAILIALGVAFIRASFSPASSEREPG